MFSSHCLSLCLTSIVGHLVATIAVPNFYTATKFAVTALTEGLRQELRDIKSNIRISTISPGVTETEFVVTGKLVKDKSESEKFYKEMGGSMSADDVTATLVHVLSAPPHVQIHDVLMRPTTEVV